MNEGDDLLRHIRGFVHGRVHPSQENLITELVAQTVVHIMTTPEFYNHLVFVQQLQLENWNLRQQLIYHQKADQVRAQRAAARKASAARTTAPAKKAPAKKAAPRKAPVKRAASKTASSNVRAFTRGASGR